MKKDDKVVAWLDDTDEMLMSQRIKNGDIKISPELDAKLNEICDRIDREFEKQGI